MNATGSEEGRSRREETGRCQTVDRIPPREPYLREGTVLNGSSLFWHQGIYNERLSKFPHTCLVPNGKSAGSLFSQRQAFVHLILVVHSWGARMLWFIKCIPSHTLVLMLLLWINVLLVTIHTLTIDSNLLSTETETLYTQKVEEATT